MKFLVTTSLALWGAMLVSGCNGGAGTANPSFNPFGTDPPGTVSEPAGGGNTTPPPQGEGGSSGSTGTGGSGGSTGTGGSGGSLGDLCASACANLESFCSSYTSPTCATECANSVPAGCETEYQAVVMCLATTTSFTCENTSMPLAPDCSAAEYTLGTCQAGT